MPSMKNSSHSSQEGMDRFELNMGQSGLDEQRHPGGMVMEELLECPEALDQDVRGRRNEEGIPGARPAGPVLGLSEFPRGPLAASSFREQDGVYLPEQTQRQP